MSTPNIITETPVICNGTPEGLPVCSPLSSTRRFSAVPDTDYIPLPWRRQAQGKRQTRVGGAASADSSIRNGNCDLFQIRVTIGQFYSVGHGERHHDDCAW
jgi:hypothetical protein